MTDTEKAWKSLADFDTETNAYCVARGEQRLPLVQAYHKAREADGAVTFSTEAVVAKTTVDKDGRSFVADVLVPKLVIEPAKGSDADPAKTE